MEERGSENLSFGTLWLSKREATAFEDYQKQRRGKERKKVRRGFTKKDFFALCDITWCTNKALTLKYR